MPEAGFVSIGFPLCALPDAVSITGVRVVMRAGAHDMAVVTASDPTLANRLVPGAPVVLEWRDSSTSRTFQGYVYKVSPRYTGGVGSSVITCVGLGFPLMSQGERTWTDVAVGSLVRELAREARLGVDVADGGARLSQVTQKPGQSFWQVLTDVADRTGCVVRVEGSTLVFRPREDWVRTFRPDARLLEYRETGDGQITRFSPVAGSYTPELGAANATHVLIGEDADGNPLRATQAPVVHREALSPIFRTVATTDAQTPEEMAVARRAVVERNRFSITAKAEIEGTASLAPEREVYVDGIDGAWNGYWTVREVEHVMRGKVYQCEVTLGTDGLGAALLLPNEARKPPVVNDSNATVNPHLAGTLTGQYRDAVLQTSTLVVGDPGRPLSGFAWSSPVVDWR